MIPLMILPNEKKTQPGKPTLILNEKIAHIRILLIFGTQN